MDFINRVGEKIEVAWPDGDTKWNQVAVAPPGAGVSYALTGHPHKDAWLSKLRASRSRCQVPRGYFNSVKGPVFVGGLRTKTQ